MITDRSRISIYNYLSDLFSSVSKNIYAVEVPTDNTQDDTTNGFIVTKVGDLKDESEFDSDCYGLARCFVTAYVPKATRGRLNKKLYATFENGINDVIKANTGRVTEGGYYIMEDSVLSMDDSEHSQKGNQYHVFVKSFVVVIDQTSNS